MNTILSQKLSVHQDAMTRNFVCQMTFLKMTSPIFDHEWFKTGLFFNHGWSKTTPSFDHQSRDIFKIMRKIIDLELALGSQTLHL